MQIYDAGEKGTAWKGRIIISREFFNPDTKDYLHIEAHEQEQEGQFIVAFWVPDGNDGGHGFDGSLRHVVQCMQSFIPLPGFVEMKIPDVHFPDHSSGFAPNAVKKAANGRSMG